ncbi:MAG: primosomal protein N' [Bacteroidota bacterium]
MPLPLPGTFSYEVPEAMRPQAQPGHRVIVSFGSTKFHTGVIRSIKEDRPPSIRDIKPVLELLDTSAVVPSALFPFLEWVSSYYMCSLGEVLAAALPSGFKLSSESLISLNPLVVPEELILSEPEEWLIRKLQEQDLGMEDAFKLLATDQPLKSIKSLQQRGIIHILEKVKEKYLPKREKRIRLQDQFAENHQALDELTGQLDKRPKQIEAVITYLKAIGLLEEPSKNKNGVARQDLINDGASASSLKTLVKNGIFVEWEAVVDRLAYQGEAPSALPSLSPEQAQAKQQLLNSFEQHPTALLRGVTGSGKTEIYMSLIDDAIHAGGRALLLLPEIALTTQIIGRFRRYFGGRFGVYHSRFSDSERVELWQKCLAGAYDFVIGVRSAAFLPISDLSLVIVDEEHEPSYKQQDPAPRYHARDVVIYRSHLQKAKVLLGSATPSFESYQNALEGKYGLVTLDQRYHDQPGPVYELADLSKERKRRLLKGTFTSVLLEQLRRTIADKDQALLFQNRRGYAPFLLCENCGHTPKCPQCDVSLTYHSFQNSLICHYCGYRESVPSTCDNCGSSDIKTMGHGTEKVEEELEILMPDLRIQRMDLDSTRSKHAYQEIIDRFEQKEIDVIIGTQIISKGLHFDDVQLVGIFDADRLIHFPDFRAHERAFQLMTQVGGRAGRKKGRGLVIIQTSDTSLRLLRHVQREDYETFFEEERKDRLEFKYPPFYRLIMVMIRHKDKRTAQQAADQFSYMVRKHLGSRVSVPIEPLVNRVRNYYRYQVLIRLEKEGLSLGGTKQLLLVTRDTLLALQAFKSIRMHFDVDPL